MSSHIPDPTLASILTALRPGRRRLGRMFAICGLVLLVATQPAAAQSTNPICQDSAATLATMIEGFLQITVALGVMGLLVVWQTETLLKMLRVGKEGRERVKQHRRRAGRSAVTLVALGPLFSIAGSAMGLPVAQCVDLVPF